MPDCRDAAREYAAMGLAVFPLNALSKKPQTGSHGFKDASTDPDMVDAAFTAHNNLGLSCGEPSGGVFAIDLDRHDPEHDGVDFWLSWEREHGELPETASSITASGGQHLFFRDVKGGLRPSVNAELGVDIRATGSYVVVPPSSLGRGGDYTWENDPEDVPIADADELVYQFVRSVQPVKPDAEKFRFDPKKGRGDRNEQLYKAACNLRGMGLDDAQILKQVGDLNDMFEEPLSRREVETIAKSASKFPTNEEKDRKEKKGRATARDDEPYLTKAGKAIPNKLAHWLIDNDGCCRIDGMPAIWEGDRYAVGYNAIERRMLDYSDGIPDKDRKETLKFLNLYMHDKTQSPATLVQFANGVFDIKAFLHGGEYFRDASEDDVITNVIPVDYVEGAGDANVTGVCNRIACDDPGTLENLIEIVGMCMVRTCDFQEVPILKGNGSNGKSVFIKMLQALLGETNMCQMDINDLGDDNKALTMAGKTACLMDDISIGELRPGIVGRFKSLSTGGSTTCNPKYQSPVTFANRATMVLTANDIPTVGVKDAAYAFVRRLHIIPLRASFKSSDEGFDPHIVQKVTTKAALKALAYAGTIGLARVFEQNGFTKTAESESAIREARLDNDPVMRWAEESYGYPMGDMLGEFTQELYRKYRNWCYDEGMRGKEIITHTKFSRQLCRDYGFTTKIKSVNGEKKRAFATRDGFFELQEQTQIAV